MSCYDLNATITSSYDNNIHSADNQQNATFIQEIHPTNQIRILPAPSQPHNYPNLLVCCNPQQYQYVAVSPNYPLALELEILLTNYFGWSSLFNHDEINDTSASKLFHKRQYAQLCSWNIMYASLEDYPFGEIHRAIEQQKPYRFCKSYTDLISTIEAQSNVDLSPFIPKQLEMCRSLMHKSMLDVLIQARWNSYKWNKFIEFIIHSMGNDIEYDQMSWNNNTDIASLPYSIQNLYHIVMNSTNVNSTNVNLNNVQNSGCVIMNQFKKHFFNDEQLNSLILNIDQQSQNIFNTNWLTGYEINSAFKGFIRCSFKDRGYIKKAFLQNRIVDLATIQENKDEDGNVTDHTRQLLDISRVLLGFTKQLFFSHLQLYLGLRLQQFKIAHLVNYIDSKINEIPKENVIATSLLKSLNYNSINTNAVAVSNEPTNDTTGATELLKKNLDPNHIIADILGVNYNVFVQFNADLKTNIQYAPIQAKIYESINPCALKILACLTYIIWVDLWNFFSPELKDLKQYDTAKLNDLYDSQPIISFIVNEQNLSSFSKTQEEIFFNVELNGGMYQEADNCAEKILNNLKQNNTQTGINNGINNSNPPTDNSARRIHIYITVMHNEHRNFDVFYYNQVSQSWCINLIQLKCFTLLLRKQFAFFMLHVKHYLTSVDTVQYKFPYCYLTNKAIQVDHILETNGSGKIPRDQIINKFSNLDSCQSLMAKTY